MFPWSEIHPYNDTENGRVRQTSGASSANLTRRAIADAASVRELLRISTKMSSQAATSSSREDQWQFGALHSINRVRSAHNAHANTAGALMRPNLCPMSTETEERTPGSKIKMFKEPP